MSVTAARATASTSTSAGAAVGTAATTPAAAIGRTAVVCSVRARRRHVLAVACRFSAIHVHGRAAVRFRLVRHSQVLGTARSPLRGSRAAAMLRLAGASRGSFTLRIALTSGSGVLGFVCAVRVR
jgi:hypothetical protein